MLKRFRARQPRARPERTCDGRRRLSSYRAATPSAQQGHARFFPCVKCRARGTALRAHIRLGDRDRTARSGQRTFAPVFSEAVLDDVYNVEGPTLADSFPICTPNGRRITMVSLNLFAIVAASVTLAHAIPQVLEQDLLGSSRFFDVQVGRSPDYEFPAFSLRQLFPDPVRSRATVVVAGKRSKTPCLPLRGQ